MAFWAERSSYAWGGGTFIFKRLLILTVFFWQQTEVSMTSDRHYCNDLRSISALPYNNYESHLEWPWYHPSVSRALFNLLPNLIFPMSLYQPQCRGDHTLLPMWLMCTASRRHWYKQTMQKLLWLSVICLVWQTLLDGTLIGNETGSVYFYIQWTIYW